MDSNDERSSDATGEPGKTTVIINPKSGNATHSEEVTAQSIENGYTVRETEAAGDAVELAEKAARDGARLVVAAGGDGTVNEVVRGVDAADALDRVAVGVVPCGTGNNFAENIGITGIEQAFDVLERGRRRQIDLGVADSRPFVNSCISGLTANASSETDADLKNRFGVLAYVINTFQSVTDFDGLRLSVDVRRGTEREPVWSGSAICVLIGNGRRFSLRGNTQANMEDGLFDVAIVEDTPPTDLVGDALLERFVGKEASQTVRLLASSLEFTGLETEPATFSLDGEMIRRNRLSLSVRKRAVTMPVGEGYDPDPEFEVSFDRP